MKTLRISVLTVIGLSLLSALASPPTLAEEAAAGAWLTTAREAAQANEHSKSIKAFEQGDVVVFKSPDTQDKRYVKRIIGMGPQAESGTVDAQTRTSDRVSVEYDRGKVFVNNHALEEDYLSEKNHYSQDRHKLDLGPDEYYVLGDNREVSKDSRSFDAIEDEAIIGRAVLRFWPPRKFSLIR